MARWLFLFFFLLLLTFTASAEGQKLALIRKIQGLEQISPGMARELERLTLKVVASQREYQLLLSGSDTPEASNIEIIAIESEVARTPTGYRIETRLLDIKRKKIKTKSAREHIREEDLVRLFEGALQALFIPDPIPAKPVLDKKPTSSAPSTYQRTGKQKSTLITSQPDQPAIDFRKRVQDMKVGVDNEIVRKVEEKNQPAAATAEVNSKIANSQVTSQKPVIKGETIQQKILQPASLPSLKSRHTFSLSWESRDIKAQDLVETTTKLDVLTLSGTGHMPLRLLKRRLGWSYLASISRPLSAPYAIPPLYQAGLYLSWINPLFIFSLGSSREATSFINLPTPGGGLQPGAIVTTQLRAMVEGNVFAWKILASYAQPIMADSDYKPLSGASWQGSSARFAVVPPLVVKNWESHIFIERTNLSAQGERAFTFNESRLGLGFQRSL